MSLDPLFAAPLVVQVHAFAAMAAFVLGIVQFAAPKGTLPHRTLGLYLGRLDARGCGKLVCDPGHAPMGQLQRHPLLSVIVLVLMPLAVLAAHRHHVNTHSRAMIGLFAGALIIAGGFTLLPGRIMHRVVFGG